MGLPKFEYLRTKTVEETTGLLMELGEKAKIISGGTDLIPAMNDGLRPEYLIDIKGIPELDYLEYDEKTGLRIGALTRLHTIDTSAVVRQNNPSVAEAAGYVASTQVRSRATMVGNLCNASPSCDTGPLLIAQGATVVVCGAQGEREMPVAELFRGVKQTTLCRGEFITGIHVPPLARDEYAAYIKHSVRRAMDLAIVGVAVWLKMSGKTCLDCRIVLGAVATTPIRVPNAEKVLIGRELTEEFFKKAGVEAMGSCHPISDVRASAEYRLEMVRINTERAIKKALSAGAA